MATPVPKSCRTSIRYLRFNDESQPGAVLTLAVFSLTLLLPLLADLAHFTPYSGNFEKRLKANRPSITIYEIIKETKLSRYPKQYTAFFNDGFGLRNAMVRVYSLFKYRVLGTFQINNVVIGRDGWLYYTHREQASDPIACYRGTNLMTNKELAAVAHTLTMWRNHLHQSGYEVVLCVIPNKSTIIPEKLPTSVTRIRPKVRLDQLYDYLAQHTDLEVLDLRPNLLAHKTEPIFYKTDTHWTMQGAYIAYDQILRYIAASSLFPALTPKPPEAFSKNNEPRKGGDLANMIILSDVFRDWRGEMKIRPEADTNATQNKPRVTVVGDSFFENLTPFFVQHFNMTTIPISSEPTLAQVQQHNPILIIIEIVERHLAKIPNWLRNYN
ncbi:alginate O-acetyltransferase complex protein AlgJ [Desulfovibrionales bacterium]